MLHPYQPRAVRGALGSCRPVPLDAEYAVEVVLEGVEVDRKGRRRYTVTAALLPPVQPDGHSAPAPGLPAHAAAAALTFGRAIFVELPGPRWAGNPEPAADAKL